MNIMADFLSDLAAKSGVSTDQAKKGLGAVLALVKDKLPANMFAQVQAAVPNADSMMADAETAKEQSSGGVLGAVGDIAAKVFGGGALAANFSKLGFSTEQLSRFLPNVLAFLKSKLPADVFGKISSLLPTSGAAG